MANIGHWGTGASGPGRLSPARGEIGHLGAGDLELTIMPTEDPERAKPFPLRGHEAT